MKYNDTIGLLTYIRQLMIGEGITIKELANRMNKTSGATSALLKQNNISLETLNCICNALNCELHIDIIKEDNINV